MLFRRPPPLPVLRTLCLVAAFLTLFFSASAQKSPPSSSGRVLLLPRTIISGERATLAVLDANGRLTPHAAVVFSNGDRLITDATGRALFVAPLNPGVIRGSIAGREGHIPVTILSPEETAATAIQVTSVPKIASLADRFEVTGRGFCGDADANQITISGDPAFVLASSPTSLVVLPRRICSPAVRPSTFPVQNETGRLSKLSLWRSLWKPTLRRSRRVYTANSLSASAAQETKSP